MITNPRNKYETGRAIAMGAASAISIDTYEESWWHMFCEQCQPEEQTDRVAKSMEGEDGTEIVPVYVTCKTSLKGSI